MGRLLKPVMMVLVVGLSSTCIFPTEEAGDLHVVVDNVIVIQRLMAGHPVRENAEPFLSQFAVGTAGDTATVACAEASAFCVWQLPPPATSAHTDSVLRGRVPGLWTLRLGDQLVVSARLERESGIVEGSRLTEVVLTKVAEDGRGPATNRVRGDTLALLSVGEVTLAVKSAGFPRAVADTVTLVVTPGWMMNPCATDQNPDCSVQTLFIGDTVSIRGGPFATLRDPVTQEVIAQLLEPEVRVYGEPAVIASRSDSQLTVFVPPAPRSARSASGPVITLVSLGIPGPCIDPPAVSESCFSESVYPFVPWDVLEPTVQDSTIGDTVATHLGTFGGGDTLFTHPSLALEDQQEVARLGGAGTARDWYTFTLASPTSLLIEATSATPLLLQLTNALEWDGLQQRHRVALDAWGIGSRLVCAGVEVDIQFQQDVLAGRRTLAVDVPAGTYHLLVGAALPLATPVRYGLTIRDGPPPLPADGFEEDDQCGGATALAAVGQSGLTLDGPSDVDWFRFTTSDSLWTTVLPRIKQTGQVLHALVVRDALPDSLPVVVDLGTLDPLPILPPDDYFLVVFSDGASGDYRLLNVIERVTVAPLGLDISTTDGPTPLVATARSPDGHALRGVATWRSLNPYRATIDALSGMVTAHASGQVTMAADIAGVTGYALVTVADPNAAPVQTWVQESDLGRDVRTVWGLSPTMVWASNTSGIWMYDGSSWTRQFFSGNQCCSAFWGASGTDVWTVATFGGAPARLLHWDGIAWSPDPMSFEPGAVPQHIWGSSPTDVWISAGDHGTLYHYDGVAWALAYRLTTALNGIWGSAADNVWAVGKDGPADDRFHPLQIFRFDGIGWNLEQERGTTTGFSQSAWGNSSEDVWTLNQGALTRAVVNRNQGGGWSGPSPVGNMAGPVTALWGSSAIEMYALGWGPFRGSVSVLYRFDGSSWQAVDLSGASIFFANAVWGTSDGPVWIVGNSVGGGLLRGIRP